MDTSFVVGTIVETPPSIIRTRVTFAPGACAQFATFVRTCSTSTPGFSKHTTCPPFPAPQMCEPEVIGSNNS